MRAAAQIGSTPQAGKSSEISDSNPLFRAICSAAMDARLGYAALKCSGLDPEHLSCAVPLEDTPNVHLEHAADVSALALLRVTIGGGELRASPGPPGT